MKASKNILAIMALMAAGVAGAQPQTPSASTTAGTAITNTASASYTDPANNPGTSNSNEVKTIVQAMPSFDVVYANSDADGSGDPANAANTATVNTPDKKDANPGAAVPKDYTLVNYGNTPLTITIKTGTLVTTQPSTLPAGVPAGSTSPDIVTKDVTYFIDQTTLPAGVTATPITDAASNIIGYTVVMPANTGTAPTVNFTQTIAIPAGALPGTIYGATPVGTATGLGTSVVGIKNGVPVDASDNPVNGIASGQTLHENQSVSNASGVEGTNGNPNTAPVGTPEVSTAASANNNSFGANDLQYEAVEIKKVTLNNDPKDPATGTTPVTPPGGTTPQPEYPAPTPPTTVTIPGGGTSPGTTPIFVDVTGDEQVAYPPADSNTADPTKKPDVVDFTNTVSNGSDTPDHIILAPGADVPTKLDTTVGSPTYGTYIPDLVANSTQVTDANSVVWTYTGTGTWTSKDINGNTVTVQFIDPATNALTDTITVPANDKATYTTQVTYPDSNPNAIDPANPAAPVKTDTPPVVKVEVTTTSGLNPNVSDVTKDTIYPAAATFGDTVAESGNLEDPSKPVGPSNSGITGGVVTPATLASTTPGNTAQFPMSISNTGQYPDTYELAGAIAIPTVGGGYTIVPVNYSGNGADTTLTPAQAAVVVTTPTTGYAPVTVKLPDGTTTTVYAPMYTTTAVAAGGVTSGLVASVTVPANALATPAGATATGTTPATYLPTVQQVATGVNSTIVMKDNNDPLKIGALGDVVVAKFTNTNGGANVAGGINPALGAQVGYNAAAGQTTVVTSTIAGGAANPVIPASASQYVQNPVGYDGINSTLYAPGVVYDYQIIGKNTYNGPITNVALKDTLKPEMLFQSATCNVYDSTYPGSIVLVAAGTLAAPVPALNDAGATVACAPATLAAGQVQVLDIKVKLK